MTSSASCYRYAEDVGRVCFRELQHFRCCQPHSLPSDLDIYCIVCTREGRAAGAWHDRRCLRQRATCSDAYVAAATDDILPGAPSQIRAQKSRRPLWKQ